VLDSTTEISLERLSKTTDPLSIQPVSQSCFEPGTYRILPLHQTVQALFGGRMDVNG